MKSVKDRENYQASSAAFRQWVSATHPQGRRKQKVEDLSLDILADLMEEYVEKMCVEKDRYGEAWIRGLHLRNPLTFQLSRGSLEGWANLDPGNSKEPLPWTTAFATSM